MIFYRTRFQSVPVYLHRRSALPIPREIVPLRLRCFPRKLRPGGNYLYAVSYLGHNLRQLVLDSAPMSESVYGADLEPAFYGLHYELFRDKKILRATLVVANLSEPIEDSPWPLIADMDVIEAHTVCHLSSYKHQKSVSRVLI